VQKVSVLSVVLAERLMIKLQLKFTEDTDIMEIILAKTSIIRYCGTKCNVHGQW